MGIWVLGRDYIDIRFHYIGSSCMQSYIYSLAREKERKKFYTKTQKIKANAFNKLLYILFHLTLFGDFAYRLKMRASFRTRNGNFFMFCTLFIFFIFCKRECAHKKHRYTKCYALHFTEYVHEMLKGA